MKLTKYIIPSFIVAVVDLIFAVFTGISLLFDDAGNSVFGGNTENVLILLLFLYISFVVIFFIFGLKKFSWIEVILLLILSPVIYVLLYQAIFYLIGAIAFGGYWITKAIGGS